MPPKTTETSRRRSPIRIIYIFAVFMLTITGFGQMPIFKRYYIADIPGLGWLAKFYTTHYLHYLFAFLFIALVAYAIADYFLLRKRGAKISPAGYFKIALLAGLIFSGVFLVIRNLPSIVFPSGMIIAFDLVHLGLVMLLLFFSAYTLITRKEWVKQAT